jgi:hypothetical protein
LDSVQSSTCTSMPITGSSSVIPYEFLFVDFARRNYMAGLHPTSKFNSPLVRKEATPVSKSSKFSLPAASIVRHLK